MRTFAILCLALAACGRGEEAPEPSPAKDIVSLAAMGGDPVTEGERLSWVLGCHGCHAADLTGQNFLEDEPELGAVYASNLTRVVPTMSDADLRRLLVEGVHPTRADLWIMPSENFQHLAPRDLDVLVAYLRTLKPAGEPSPPPVLTELARREIAAGTLKTAKAWVADAEYRPLPELGPGTEEGRLIAMTGCAECHGGQLQGGDGPPDLVVASGYTREEFETLITTGVPTGGRTLKPLMQSVAQKRYARLTPEERDSLYLYLKKRAERPEPPRPSKSKP